MMEKSGRKIRSMSNYKKSKIRKDSKKNQVMGKTTSKSNRSNPNSNNTSMNKSINNKLSNKKENIEEEKEIEPKINKELINQQYKIIKDFLIPILKEENAKHLVSYYNKMTKVNNNLLKKKKFASLKKRSILEYSFITGQSHNKPKIPLFQILFPKQYNNHLETRNKQRLITNNRPCRNISTTNIISNINNINNKISSSTNIKNEIKSTLLNNKEINKKIKKRPKTPPLYLRINEVKEKHDELIEKLKQKYEFKNNKNNLNKSTSNLNENGNKTDISFSEISSSSSTMTKNRRNFNFEKWYNYEKTWQKMKDMKINIIKSEIEENKMCMNLYNKREETFKPKINKNTKLIMTKKYDDDFYMRLKAYKHNKEQKEKLLRQKLKPKFKPFINTNYNINQEYYGYMRYDQKGINKDLKFFLEENKL